MSDPVDLEALAEARNVFTETHQDMELFQEDFTILAAVDALLEADQTGWCETHDFPFYQDEPSCEKVWNAIPCSYVRRVLVPVKGDTE